MNASIEKIKSLLQQTLAELPPSQHHLIDEVFKELSTLSQTLSGSQSDDPQPIIDKTTGCYQFEGDSGFYCPHCFDNQQRKVSTQRINSKLRICTECRSSLKRLN